MWERQYERGRWNGHQLNILATAIDGGQRLHVSEIPYAELPNIRVMGSKSRTIKLDVVFVGADSLADANAFIANLESSPTGELEHPWLGELTLVFDTFSQSISTKRGVVTLSLSFVRAGTQPIINTSATVRVKQQASTVESVSAQSFARNVKSLSVADINQTQNDFTQSLNVLVDITHRLNLADDKLQSINSAINEAFGAISSISSAPDKFATLLSTAVDRVAEGVQSEPDSDSEAVDNARTAQQLMLGQVKEDAVTPHHNIQMVTGAVKVSKDVTRLEKQDQFDITAVSKQPAIIQSDLAALIDGIDERVTETTSVSTVESLDIFDALVALKGGIQTQHDKVIKGTAAHRVIEQPRSKPALTIAHDQYTAEPIVTAMNALQHPLFLRGDIAVRNPQ
ncbi:DNA circularization N-terminal domain-containing protein [Vibrio fluvialis]|uniref:DNA circularization N-terminal domain-containing protein n=1 Tax=Vibrio fluvialis TaxID=676 RepID=UPI001F1871D5|nr:DNA circularization N-terminal domain-containing protein [Vibrio fluvialis]MCE7615709.1 DNA circularization N-terminal domain-containing protein [Vibrio fluvialis]